MAPGLSIPSLAGPRVGGCASGGPGLARPGLAPPAAGRRPPGLGLAGPGPAGPGPALGPGWHAPVSPSESSDETKEDTFHEYPSWKPRSSRADSDSDVVLLVPKPADSVPPSGPRPGRAGDGLGGALSTFGAPAEWWHDSIILGRLSALALRYFASRATLKPWRAWLQHVQRAREKHGFYIRSQKQLALRTWHRNSVRHGRRMQNKLPLILALQKVVQSNLQPAWRRYRQAVFLQRDVDRRLRLLHIIRWKMMNTMAQVHYCQTLQRLGLAGLWLASKSKDVASRSPSPANSPEVGWSSAKSHVQQVVSRAWRKWWFATRMWLTSAQFRERALEAWLAGECSTPRSMVVAEAFEGEDAGPMALDPVATPMSTLFPRDLPVSTRLSQFSLEGISKSHADFQAPVVLQHAVEDSGFTASLPRVRASRQKSRPWNRNEEVSTGAFQSFGRSRSYSGRKAFDQHLGADVQCPSRHDSVVSDEEVAFVNDVGLSTDSTGRDSKIGLLPRSDRGSPMPDSPGNNYWAMRRSISRPSVLKTRCR